MRDALSVYLGRLSGELSGVDRFEKSGGCGETAAATSEFFVSFLSLPHKLVVSIHFMD